MAGSGRTSGGRWAGAAHQVGGLSLLNLLLGLRSCVLVMRHAGLQQRSDIHGADVHGSTYTRGLLSARCKLIGEWRISFRLGAWLRLSSLAQWAARLIEQAALLARLCVHAT